MSKVKSPRYGGCYIQLSNGSLVDMNYSTIQEGIQAFDNFLSMIVMGNFKKILKISNESPENDKTVDIIEEEVIHLVENELTGNYKCVLQWILLTCALERLDFITTEVRKRQKKE